MFDFLFARRKASECEKLIRGVQWRLKLLKSKRNSIVRWLWGTIAQLLQDGHKQTAFDRVEQMFKDESIVAVYELLDIFCELILFDLPDICKHRDCPKYVNEAASTLIFASARLGDLPELRAIRKFFGELYGQRFNLVALELLPGNHVNELVKNNLSITSVPDYVKFKLLDEIASSCPKPAPSAHLEQVNSCTSLDQDWDAPRAGSDGSISPLSLPWYVDKKDELGTGNYAHLESPHESRLPAPWLDKEVGMAAESSSDSSYWLPKEMIFLDDVEEFKSTIGTDGNGPDQRFFLFKTPVSFETDRAEDVFDESNDEDCASRSSRKSRKASEKRRRMRSVSKEGITVKDVESTMYYEWPLGLGNCQNESLRSHHQQKHQKRTAPRETRKSLGAQARVVQPCHQINNGDDRNVNECRVGVLVPNKAKNEEVGKPDGFVHAPNLRATTSLPVERSSDCRVDHVVRSNTFPFQQASPVHPKLPDCDELAAKFMALKKAYQECKSDQITLAA